MEVGWKHVVSRARQHLLSVCGDTHGESRLLGQGGGLGLLLSLLSMGIAHDGGRGDQGRSQSSVETHGG